MPVDDELVELLIMAETATAFQLATGCADAMGEAILRTARDMVDVSSVLGRPHVLCRRTTRRDVDTATIRYYLRQYWSTDRLASAMPNQMQLGPDG